MRTARRVFPAIAIATLVVVTWSRAASVTGARLGELDLYDDQSLTHSKTVDASKIGFPLSIEDSNAKAVKVRYQGRSYWVIRALVETEGLESALRKEPVSDQSVGGVRGLGK